MGGFLSALGTLAGGFNTARRIDKEGFRFREDEEAKLFDQERKVELARQADRDRRTKQIEDILAGQVDAGGAAPAPIDDFFPQADSAELARDTAQARGSGLQSRASIEALRGINRSNLLGQRQEGAESLVGLRGDERLEQIRLQQEFAAGTITASDQARLDAFNARTKVMADRPTGGSGRLRQVREFNRDTGEVETFFVTDEEARGESPVPEGVPRFGTVSSTEQNRISAANKSIKAGESILAELDRPEFQAVLGPVMGRYKSLERAAGFGDPFATNLAGTIIGLAALQPQIHGFRAFRFAKDIEQNLLTAAQTPESLAAGIRGLLAVSQSVAGQDILPFDLSGLPGAEPEGANRSPEEIQSLLQMLDQLDQQGQ